MPTLSQQEAAILEAARAYAKAYQKAHESIHGSPAHRELRQRCDIAEHALNLASRGYGL